MTWPLALSPSKSKSPLCTPLTLCPPSPPFRHATLPPTPRKSLRNPNRVDPSGGDWGIRRAGLLHLEGTARVNISGSTFFRTDANAVMVAAFNRNASIVDCEFSHIGMSSVVTFGRTVQDDGSSGEQPFGTLIAYNKVHEMGAFQLQSSAWFTSRAALTRAEGLVVFNIPRAAINFNDAFGGGNNVTLASILNTCRHSSDHGPMVSPLPCLLHFTASIPLTRSHLYCFSPFFPSSFFSFCNRTRGTECPFTPTLPLVEGHFHTRPA